MATGIAPDVWAQAGWRTIITASELLDKSKAKQDDEGRQMSG